jgi:hypothetical protein
MINTENVATELFNKIRSRFENVSLGDEKSKATSDPSSARFFNFDYIGQNGKKFGNVTISIVDNESLKIMFGKSITDRLHTEEIAEWNKFLLIMKKFARSNMMRFDVRDNTKDSLELRDVKQQSRHDSTFDASEVDAVTESRMWGTSRSSYQECGPARIIVRHNTNVDPEKRGSRSRNIDAVFIENHVGERRLLPFKNLHGARAMAQHCSNGGSVDDAIGEHISGMCTEMSAMAHFVREAKRRQFEDRETQEMAHAAIQHYNELRNHLRHIGKQKGYAYYSENFVPPEPIEDTVDVDGLRERFVKKIYNDKFDAALPYVYRAHQKYKKQQPSMGGEFESWVHETAMSEDMEDEAQQQDFKELMKHPLAAGFDGQDAWNELKYYFNDIDPEMENTLSQLSSDFGPDVDARQTVLSWMKSNGMTDFADEIYGELTQVNQAPQQPPQQPAAPQNDQVGTTGMDTPVPNPMQESDDLSFIRTLAGLSKKE